MAIARRLVGVLIASSLSSCSPYPYEKQAGSLDQAITGLRSSYSAGRAQLVADRNQTNAIEWTITRPLLVTQDCSVQPSATAPCTIVRDDAVPTRAGRGIAPAQPSASPPAVQASTTASGITAPKPMEQEPDACDMVNAPAPELVPLEAGTLKAKVNAASPPSREQVFASLEDYSHGLAAITKSQDRTDYNNAVGELAAGVSSLGTAVGVITGQPAGALIGPLATATTKAVFWLVGTGLDYRRYETLKDATVRACRPVHILADVVAVILEEQQSERLRELSAQITDKLNNINVHHDRRTTNDRAYARMIDDSFKVVVQYNTLRDSKPSELGASVASAHNKLVLAIWRGDDQSGTVIQALNDLADHVKAVREAANGAAIAAAE